MSVGRGLVEWLTTCLDEDAARWRESAGDERHQRWAREESGDLNEGFIVEVALQMLAEVDVKRRIIERLHHEPYEGLRNSWEYGEVVTEEYVSCTCGWEKVITHGHDWDDLYAAHCDELGVNPTIAEAVLRLLALPYAGRDGWRDEWRPQ